MIKISKRLEVIAKYINDGSKENPYRIKMATQKKTKKSSN